MQEKTLTNYEQFAVLICKAGVFFANCDGDYAESEQTFIADYIDRLHGISSLNNAVFEQINSIDEKNLNIEEVIADAKALLDGQQPAEREKAHAALLSFVDKVIEADGIIHPNEVHYKQMLINALQ